MKKSMIAVTLGVVAALSGCDGKPKKDSPAMVEIKKQRMAREFTSNFLKDPKSAEFRNQKEFCGEVNSKNTFGAYTGYQRFIAAGAEMVVLERDSGLPASQFEDLWRQACQ